MPSLPSDPVIPSILFSHVSSAAEDQANEVIRGSSLASYVKWCDSDHIWQEPWNNAESSDPHALVAIHARQSYGLTSADLAATVLTAKDQALADQSLTPWERKAKICHYDRALLTTPLQDAGIMLSVRCRQICYVKRFKSISRANKVCASISEFPLAEFLLDNGFRNF